MTPTLPLLQRELGMSPAEGALLSIVLLITGALVTPVAGKFGDRYGGKRVLIRLMAVVSVGGLVSALAPNLPPEIWHLVVGKALIALANGLCVTALMAGTATSVDRSDTGIATSLILVTRVLGYAVGGQLGGALLTAGTPSGSDVPAESAYVTGFLIAGAVTALALFVTRTMRKGVKE